FLPGSVEVRLLERQLIVKDGFLTDPFPINALYPEPFVAVQRVDVERAIVGDPETGVGILVHPSLWGVRQSDIVAGEGTQVDEGVVRGAVGEGEAEIEALASVEVLAREEVLEAQGRPRIPDFDQILARVVIPVRAVNRGGSGADGTTLAGH